MISLSKITISNFKVFGAEPYTLNFNGDRLVLLDGPNGYGKTSVFDAIELGITGNISRLISLEARQNPADVVVAHQGNENVEVILEFVDSESNVKVFQRKMKGRVPDSHKKISKFKELWELNEIVDGRAEPSSQDKLNQYFGSTDLARDFLLFHYVQQEETSRFLKTKNETQRAEELAQLFGNTRESDEKLKKLIDISRNINNTKRKISSRILEIKQLYKIDDFNNIKTEANQPHVYALPWLAETNMSPFWDLVAIPELDQEKFNSSLAEITHVKNLLRHQFYFLRNRRFENAIRQREILELYVGYFNSIADYDAHVKQSQRHRLIESCYIALKSRDLKKIRKIQSFETLFNALNLEDSVVFESSLQHLIDEEKKSVGLNSIYSELLKHHNSLSADLDRMPDESACLLCGQGYESHDALNHAIIKHGHLLRSELSGQEKVLVTTRDSFDKTHLSPLIDACAAYLNETQAPSQEELLALSKALNMKERFAKLRDWLFSEHIEHDDLLLSMFPATDVVNSISEATDFLCERIRAAIGEGPDGYHEANLSNVFDRIYRDYFNSQHDRLAQLDVGLLDRKERYVKDLYFASLKEVSSELVELSKRHEIMVRAANDVDKLAGILKGKIKQYRKKLITDIEIPFYIYSGKILQSHQAGLGHGIFIKDPTGLDELKNVRLVSNWESDHDILNTMSSGQISAVVIALTLALHKVYANRFSSIFIDDPVQTMDDINMSSLVEVLRNDFREKYIILSTHEDKVVRYFTYKYLKHHEEVKIINLMQRKEWIPRDKFLYREGSGG